MESAGLTQLLFNKETNVLGRAMGVLNDDLTFAEDLLLVSLLNPGGICGFYLVYTVILAVFI